MQIVINLPKRAYKEICSGNFETDGYFKKNLSVAFKNGTVLPKGHGRLKDTDMLITELKERHDFFVNAYGGFDNMLIQDKARVDEIEASIAEILNAPTIIEADKEKQHE